MGNYIKTKDGLNISLNIPAQITSFETNGNENNNSHITRGKLKVFSIGRTGDNRVFTPAFADSLMATLPGTPVVAYYDEETDDFIGHNDEQYVYGYVPENAVPEFVEDGGKTWAVVDVNLFTERQDKIGEIANKIIGKAQSLELNPDTVDWEIIYVNNRLDKIVFKQGSFYGLSVLGDNQKPAFEGAGFFTSDIIEQLTGFQNPLKNDGGNLEMNKTDFLSLGIQEKLNNFSKMIADSGLFDTFFVIDFNEEEVFVRVFMDDDYICGESKFYAIQYRWVEDTSYEFGSVYEVIPGYIKKENASSDPSSFKKEEEDAAPAVSEEGAEGAEEETEVVETAAEEPAEETAAESDSENSADAADGEVGEMSDIEDKKKEERDCDEPQEDMKEKEEKTGRCEEIATYSSTLSIEERNELNELRREKKMSLISNYKEFLSDEALEQIVADLDKYDFVSLERELKVQSFDATKKKIQEHGKETFGIILPSVKAVAESTLDRLVSENI